MSSAVPVSGVPERAVRNAQAAECRLCGRRELSRALEARGWELVHCAHCDYLQVTRPPTDDELAAIYSDAYFSHSKYRNPDAINRENARRLELLQGYLPAGGSVLDAGCATGDFVTAAKTAYQVWGFDLSSFAIDIAKRNNPEIMERFSTGTLRDMGDSGRRFDAICLWDVIEHLRDPVEACTTLFALLKPGGLLLVSTPSVDAPIARLMGPYWAFMTPPEHLGFFSRASTRYLFSSRVPGELLHFSRRGKWANLAFIAYKARRVAPALMPQFLVSALESSWAGRIPLYVPTGDVLYAVARKAR